MDRSSLILGSKAYEKLVWFRDRKDTEVGAMGISLPEDPLHIADFAFLPQECTSVSTDFDTAAQDAWMEEMMIDKGLSPDQFTRVWAHTHPSQSASPSSTDWDTFQEVMGNMPWGVMLILGTSNEFSCVFRVKEQLLNMPVLVMPHEVDPAWATELENIKRPQPKQVPQWSGYTSEWDTYQPNHSYGKAKKRKKKLELCGWQTAVSPAWGKFKSACDKLTNDTPYPQLHTWSPSFEEVMATGPCRTLSLLKEAYENCTSDFDFGKVESMAEALSALLASDLSFMLDWMPEQAVESDVLSFMIALRESEDPSKEYPFEQYQDYYEYLEIKPNKQGVKQWFMTDKPCYAASIPDLFTSAETEHQEEALSACLTAVNNFQDYCETIDSHCRHFAEKHLAQLQEYDQLILDHEMNVTDDTQVS